MDKVRAIQDKELDMLVQLANLLDKNGISFYLAYGTALGCVRHQGFIPWDDDLDIFIMGEDYPKLRRVFLEEDTGDLALHDASTVEGYPYVFPKVVANNSLLVERSLSHLEYRGGVYIDVFPLFGISDSIVSRAVGNALRYVRYGLLRSYYNRFDSPARKLIGSVVRAVINPNRAQEKLYHTYVSGTCGEYFATPIEFKSKGFTKREYFSESLMMPFAGVEMPIMASYDEYLTDYYGDYMTLPDEADRVAVHDIVELQIDGCTYEGNAGA